MDGTVRWSREFGPEYRPPRELLDLVGKELEDHSWHNDVCPLFGLRSPTTDEIWVAIWSDAERPEDREDPTTSRFLVILYGPDGPYTGCSIDYHATDDLDDAITTFRRFRGQDPVTKGRNGT